MRLDVWYDSLRKQVRVTTVSFFTTLDPCMVPLLISITRIVPKEGSGHGYAPFVGDPSILYSYGLISEQHSARKAFLLLQFFESSMVPPLVSMTKILFEKEIAPGEQKVTMVRSFFYGYSILEWYSLLSAV